MMSPVCDWAQAGRALQWPRNWRSQALAGAESGSGLDSDSGIADTRGLTSDNVRSTSDNVRGNNHRCVDHHVDSAVMQ